MNSDSPEADLRGGPVRSLFWTQPYRDTGVLRHLLRDGEVPCHRLLWNRPRCDKPDICRCRPTPKTCKVAVRRIVKIFELLEIIDKKTGLALTILADLHSVPLLQSCSFVADSGDRFIFL